MYGMFTQWHFSSSKEMLHVAQTVAFGITFSKTSVNAEIREHVRYIS